MGRQIASIVLATVVAVATIAMVTGAFTTSEKKTIQAMKARITALERQAVVFQANDVAVAADIEALDDDIGTLNANDQQLSTGLTDLVADDGPLAELNQMILDLDARMDGFDPPIALTGIRPIATCTATMCTVDVEWSSDPPATGQVEWGETTTYGNLTTKETNLLDYHRQRLGTFPADGKTYHFRIIASTPGDGASISTDGTLLAVATP